MVLCGENVTDGDECRGAYRGELWNLRRQVRGIVAKVERITSVDNRFLAKVKAFRVLMEGDSNASDNFLAKSEVDAWEVAYLGMFERLKRKIPKKIDPAKMKAVAIGEFDRLRKLAKDDCNYTPDGWLPEVEKDLALLEVEQAFYLGLDWKKYS